MLMVILAFLSLLIWFIAQQIHKADSTFTDEPEAHALYDQMIETMRNAETLYYESEYRWKARGKKIGHCTYRFWAKKPNYARFASSTRVANLKACLFWMERIFGFIGQVDDLFFQRKIPLSMKKLVSLLICKN